MVVARYDNRRYNDKKVRCNGNFKEMDVGVTKNCWKWGMPATDEIEVTVIYREELVAGGYLDHWTKLELIVDWAKLGDNSKVEIIKKGTKVKTWTGKLGRNDKHGPYMKYGIYSSSSNQNFYVKFKNAYSEVDNS